VEGYVAVGEGLFLGRFADNRALFDVPGVWVAIPVLEADAIENLDVSLVLVEIERLRLVEAIVPLDSFVGLLTLC